MSLCYNDIAKYSQLVLARRRLAACPEVLMYLRLGQILLAITSLGDLDLLVVAEVIGRSDSNALLVMCLTS